MRQTVQNYIYATDEQLNALNNSRYKESNFPYVSIHTQQLRKKKYLKLEVQILRDFSWRKRAS
jgi:hypothetical protein